MNLTAGINLIKKFEGCRLTSYPDPATGGIPWTIGWGNTKDTKGNSFGPGAKITQENADALLLYTIEHKYLSQLAKIPYWNEMNDNQKGAILSFAYNLGAGFYESSGFSIITKVLKEKRWKDIVVTLKLYRNPGSNVESGLLKRRIAEGKLWGSHI